MNGLDRNKRTFYYAVATTGTDEWGNVTGVVWGNPTLARANISAAGGAIEQHAFGFTQPYDRVINPLPKNFPASATMRLWVDTMPTITLPAGTTTTPHDYVPVLASDGINHRLMAIRKVTAS